MTSSHSRLHAQIAFLLEIDKLKSVFRRSYHLDGSGHENDAEHSWHLAVAALLLHEYASETVDLLRVVKMVLVHDVVEVDVGDVFIYDEAQRAEKLHLERAAAQRIFGLLPADQADALLALWEEFEAALTPEARFARALDRLLPHLHNYYTEGRAWREHHVTADRVLAVNQPVLRTGAPDLEVYATELILDAVKQGYLASGEEKGERG